MAVVLEAGPELYATVLGALRAGWLPTVLAPPSPRQDPELHWAAHRALFARVRPAAAVTFPEHVGALGELALEFGAALVTRESPGLPAADATLRADEPALLQHSSGTTGLKKGVVLTHHNVLYEAVSTMEAAGFGEAQRQVSYLPLAHIAERVLGLYGPQVVGGHVHCIGDPAQLLATLGEVHPTAFFGVPRVWEKIKTGLSAKLGDIVRKNLDRDPARRYSAAYQLLQRLAQTPEASAAERAQSELASLVREVSHGNPRLL